MLSAVIAYSDRTLSCTAHSCLGMCKVSYSDEPAAASANGSGQEAAEEEGIVIDVEAN